MHTSYGDHPTHPGDELTRPAHDAVVELIHAETLALPAYGQYDRHEAELRLAGLYSALYAVDSLRYRVEPSTLAGVRARGWTVEDTWTGDSLQWFAGRAQAEQLANEQNQLNADEAAAELATRLDTYVGA